MAGREDVDVWTSLYWSIITMATIGYGDITPVKGLDSGWVRCDHGYSGIYLDSISYS